MISPSSRQPVHPGTFYGGIVCAGAGAASTIISGRTLRGLPGSRSQRDLAGRSGRNLHRGNGFRLKETGGAGDQ
jgi:hypothetical protein